MRYTTEEIRANRWKLLNALRSGKYPQARGALRTPDGFCCLGVACDVIDPNGWNEIHYDEWVFHMQEAYLPNDVIEAFGFDPKEDGYNPRDNRDHAFADDMNDKGVPFEEIADAMEATFRADEHGL